MSILYETGNDTIYIISMKKVNFQSFYKQKEVYMIPYDSNWNRDWLYVYNKEYEDFVKCDLDMLYNNENEKIIIISSVNYNILPGQIENHMSRFQSVTNKKIIILAIQGYLSDAIELGYIDPSHIYIDSEYPSDYNHFKDFYDMHQKINISNMTLIAQNE